MTAAGFNMAEFSSRLRQLEKRQAGRGRRAMVLAAEQIIGDAAELCPVKTGTLKASGTVDDSHVGKGDGDLGFVRFGFNTAYAAAVHERTELRHEQGQAKFLEAAIVNGLPRINDVVGRQLAL